MEQRKRQEFIESQAQITGSPVLLGKSPTQEQAQQMAQAQTDRHCIGVAQAMFNQVVANWLTSQEGHQQLTHERVQRLAQQCQATAPYVLAQFGVGEIIEKQLPSEPESETD